MAESIENAPDESNRVVITADSVDLLKLMFGRHWREFQKALREAESKPAVEYHYHARTVVSGVEGNTNDQLPP